MIPNPLKASALDRESGELSSGGNSQAELVINLDDSIFSYIIIFELENLFEDTKKPTMKSNFVMVVSQIKLG